MAYQAVVTRARTRPHPNADALQLATVMGNQVVVGLDVEDGTLGVFFPTDGQLSEAYAEANDLVGYTDPETGERRGGFFAENRRVKSIRLRGEKSDGYWAPLSSLHFVRPDVVGGLVEGSTFTELDGVPICNKYFTPATARALGRSRQGRTSRGETPSFPKHFDTTQFRTAAHLIPAGSRVSITEKEHGTSGRFGYALEQTTVELSLAARLRRFLAGYGFGAAVEDERYAHLLGSRNVILEPSGPEAGTFSGNPYRTNVVAPLVGNLLPGEVLYFEIVGWQDGATPIMGAHDVKKLRDKKLAKAYGDRMVYRYGCPEGTQRMRVYRITRALQGGGHYELPWERVKARCAELGADHVEDLVPPFTYDGDVEALSALVEGLTDGPSTVDPSHIREGVVVRAETPHGDTLVLKNKSFDFGLLEGYLKEADDFVDLEEAS